MEILNDKEIIRIASRAAKQYVNSCLSSGAEITWQSCTIYVDNALSSAFRQAHPLKTAIFRQIDAFIDRARLVYEESARKSFLQALANGKSRKVIAITIRSRVAEIVKEAGAESCLCQDQAFRVMVRIPIGSGRTLSLAIRHNNMFKDLDNLADAITSAMDIVKKYGNSARIS